MKKIFLFIVLILGTSLSSLAGEAMSTTSGLNVIVNESSNPGNNANLNSLQDSETDASVQNAKKKKKKKMKTWHYIASGVFIALIIVFYVITGGEGWSSR